MPGSPFRFQTLTPQARGALSLRSVRGDTAWLRYADHQRGANAALIAFDLGRGVARWSRPLRPGAFPSTEVQAGDGWVAADDGDHVSVFDPDGERIWRSGYAHLQAADRGHIALYLPGEQAVELRRGGAGGPSLWRSGRLRCQQLDDRAEGAFGARCLALLVEDQLGTTRSLVGLSLDDGAERWRLKLPAAGLWKLYGPPNRAHLSRRMWSGGARLYALDPDAGSFSELLRAPGDLLACDAGPELAVAVSDVGGGALQIATSRGDGVAIRASAAVPHLACGVRGQRAAVALERRALVLDGDRWLEVPLPEAPLASPQIALDAQRVVISNGGRIFWCDLAALSAGAPIAFERAERAERGALPERAARAPAKIVEIAQGVALAEHPELGPLDIPLSGSPDGQPLAPRDRVYLDAIVERVPGLPLVARWSRRRQRGAAPDWLHPIPPRGSIAPPRPAGDGAALLRASGARVGPLLERLIEAWEGDPTFASQLASAGLSVLIDGFSGCLYGDPCQVGWAAARSGDVWSLYVYPPAPGCWVVRFDHETGALEWLGDDVEFALRRRLAAGSAPHRGAILKRLRLDPSAQIPAPALAPAWFLDAHGTNGASLQEALEILDTDPLAAERALAGLVQQFPGDAEIAAALERAHRILGWDFQRQNMKRLLP